MSAWAMELRLGSCDAVRPCVEVYRAGVLKAEAGLVHALRELRAKRPEQTVVRDWADAVKDGVTLEGVDRLYQHVRTEYFDLRDDLREDEDAGYPSRSLQNRVNELEDLLAVIGEVRRAYAALRAAELRELQEAGAVVNLRGGARC